MTTMSMNAVNPVQDCLASLADGGRQVTKYVGDSVRGFVTYTTAIKDDANAHANLWKSIPAGLTALGHQGLIHGPAGGAVRFLEGWQLLGDVSDIMEGKLGSNLIQTAQRVFFAISNLGTTLVWGHELGIISMGTGLLSTFSGLASGGATVGYGVGAISAVWTLATCKDHKYSTVIRNKALLDLIASVAGAALTAIVFLGASFSSLSIALLVLTSAGFGILSFCYAKKHKKAFEEKEVKANAEPTIWTHCRNFANNSESLEKIAKLFNKLADGASLQWVVALTKDSKSFIEMHEILNFPKRMFEWLVPKEVIDDKGNVTLVYSYANYSKLKIVGKGFLTALSLVTLVAFTIKFKLVESAFLLSLAAATIGGVPFLTVLAPAAYIGYATCGFIENSLQLSNEYTHTNLEEVNIKNYVKWKKDEKMKLVTTEKKLAKWQDIQKQLKSRQIVEQNMGKKLSEISCKKRYNKSSKEEQAVLKSMNAESYTTATLARLNARHENARVRCNRAGINLLTEGSKGLGATLFLASLYLAGSVVAAPILGTVVLASSCLSLVGAGMGVIKVIKDEDFKKTYQEPRFAAYAAA